MSVRRYPFQRETNLKIEEFEGRALASLEMSLGKTIIALWHIIKMHPELRPAVIGCPASAKYNWEAEARNHFGVRLEIISGRKVPWRWLQRKHDIVVINYDILKDWLNTIVDIKPKIIVWDECQYLCDPSTQRTKAAAILAKECDHLLALSGTPFSTNPLQMFPVLKMLKPKEFPSFRAFAEMYSNLKRRPWGWVFEGSKNLKQLHERLLNTCMIRKRKCEVLGQLPAKVRCVVPLELSQRKEYEEANRDFIGWLRKNDPLRVRGAILAQAVSYVTYMKRLAAKLKMPSVLKWLDDFLLEDDGKLLIFAYHKDIISRLREKYGKISILVDGSITGEKRQEAFEIFQREKKCRVFIGQIRAAGAAWNAKGCANTAFVELDWVPNVHLQAEGRTHGLKRGIEGATSSYHYLIGYGTIEEKICKLLTNRFEETTNVLDGGESDENFDIIGDLIKEMKGLNT